MGIANLVYKERVLSRIGKDSLIARSAADVGMECMLSSDRMPTDFDPITNPVSFPMNCGRDNAGSPVGYTATLTSTTPSSPPYTNYKYTVDITASSVDGPCFVGYLDRDTTLIPSKTNIKVQGYNICDNSNPARVERGIEANYDSLAGGGGGSACNPGFMCATVTGGTEVISGLYKIVTFDTPGSVASFDVTQLGSGIIEVLVIGGGGGGGIGQFGVFGGGGGGSGEVNHSLAYNILTMGPYSVSIGSGGLGATASSTDGTNGNSSTFDTITAIGGGYGAGFYQGWPWQGIGGSGASGGGGSYDGRPGGVGSIHFNGGAGWTSNTAAGGGGGAGGLGQNAPNGNTGGDGGIGLFKNITGTLIEYAKGGGGGGQNANGTPSGNGATYGSGGGGSSLNLGAAGDGKSGAVIIKYKFR